MRDQLLKQRISEMNNSVKVKMARPRCTIIVVVLEALKDEEANDIMWFLMSRLLGQFLRHFTRNMRSCSSSQYIRGRR